MDVDTIPNLDDAKNLPCFISRGCLVCDVHLRAPKGHDGTEIDCRKNIYELNRHLSDLRCIIDFECTSPPAFRLNNNLVEAVKRTYAMVCSLIDKLIPDEQDPMVTDD